MTHLHHGRLRPLDPGGLDSAQREVYEAITGGPRAAGPQAFALVDGEGHLEGPFNAMLVSPRLGMPLQQLGAAIRYASHLDDRLREIAILELARLNRCEFEWYAHRAIGARIGLNPDELAGLESGDPIASLSGRESMARHLVGCLHRRETIDDDDFARAHALLGSEELADLVVLVGYYELLALSLAFWHTPLPDGVRPSFGDEPGPA